MNSEWQLDKQSIFVLILLLADADETCCGLMGRHSVLCNPDFWCDALKMEKKKIEKRRETLKRPIYHFFFKVVSNQDL